MNQTCLKQYELFQLFVSFDNVHIRYRGLDRTNERWLMMMFTISTFGGEIERSSRFARHQVMMILLFVIQFGEDFRPDVTHGLMMLSER